MNIQNILKQRADELTKNTIAFKYGNFKMKLSAIDNTVYAVVYDNNDNIIGQIDCKEFELFFKKQFKKLESENKLIICDLTDLPVMWKRGKSWNKILKGVDTSKGNGYAFVGEWLPQKGKVELSEGSYILRYSEKYRGCTIFLYQVQNIGGDNLTEVYRKDLNFQSGWALEVRDEIAEIINE